MTRICVALSAERAYDIHIGAGVLERAGAWLGDIARSPRVVVLTEPAIGRRHGQRLLDGLRAGGLDPTLIAFTAGERRKHLGTIARVYGELYNLPGIDRKTLLVALGGGVVGDMVGFVAATYLRGMDYVQVPTTLLALVDSAVGGKTGVDFRDGKNLIGAFHQPRAVLADTAVLGTLPLREVRAGLAEVVKYGIIREPALLGYLMANATALLRRDGDALEWIGAQSCAIKADVVGADEREETGVRAILNYGHTIGHALESATQYRRYKHGEAIAIGMVSAACIGEAAGVTPPAVRPTLVALLQRLGLPTALPVEITDDTLIALTRRDKKAESGTARYVLARGLGDVALTAVDDAVVRQGLWAHRRSEIGSAGHGD
jgi:3-dehydroquinate synthase